MSKPLGALTVHHDVETTGGEGMSLEIEAEGKGSEKTAISGTVETA